MREDAAAAARRIVEEVLARHGQEDASATETVATPRSATPSPEAVPASAPTTLARDAPADASTRGDDRDDAETELLAAAGEAASEATRIARRIVAEALAEADPPPVQPAADASDGAAPEVSVRGVPAEGLLAEDEQTVGIEAPGESTHADGASGESGDTDTSPSPAGTPQPSVADPLAPAAPSASAAEIVRRIVADVQAEAGDEHPEDEPAGPEAEAATSPDEPEAPGEPEPAPPVGAARSEGDTAMLPEERPETPTAALPPWRPATVGAPTHAHTAGTPAAAPVAGRELEGWAAPLRPQPTPAPPGQEEGAPRTLRWLVASLLGAVALAVLFPLAVAALRTLVAMD